jgi:ATP-dependent RNA helicase DeaD
VNLVEKTVLDRIAHEFSVSFEQRTIPSDEDVEVVVSERTTALLEARLRLRDKLQTERSHRFAPLAHSLAENEDELPIITMLLDDYYQQTLHAPIIQPSGTTSNGKKHHPGEGRKLRRRH